MSAIQALQLWCKQQCEGYKDVSVTNMTTSFRDGLAFCAILHRHRPDLINFTSLSKENVFENNELAFQVAEKELGIPALLDAEDMVALKVPDRLSILTYVSQYYNYFHGKSPIGGMAGIKRPASQPSEQPTGKKMISEPTAPSFTKPARQPSPLESKTEPAAPGHSPMVNASPVQRRVLAEKSNTPHSNCAVCGAHVHLVQRLLVDGKLYHRNCFRCKECSRTLQRGNYTAGLGPGAFLCSQHAGPAPAQGPPAQEIHGEKDPPKTAPGNSGMGLEPMPAASPGVKPSWAFRNNNATRPAAWEPSDSKNNKTSSPSLHRWDPPDQTADQPSTSPSTGSRLKIQQAREKFFQADPPPASFPAGKAEPVRNHSSPFKPSQVPEKTALSRMQVPSHSEKDQARSILSRVLPGPQPSTSQPGAVGSASPRSVASKGNPLPPGSSGSRSPQPQNFLVSRPLNKPAFAEAAGVTETHHPVANLPKDPSYKVGVRADPQNKAKDRSLGPSVNSGRKSDTKVAKARSANVVEEKLGSPEDWRSRLKPVKLPHQVETKTSPKSEDVHKVVINKEVKPGQKDKKPSLSVVSPAVPKAVPLAFQPQKKKLLVPQLDVSSSWQTVKQPWESHPSTAQAGRRNLSKKVVATDQPSAPGTFRKPPSDQALSPTQRHPDYVPEEEIQKEVQRIERDLDRLEQKGISLEKQLRGCEGDDSEDVLMVEWFKLIHEKQLLLRWESELMHKMNQQKLEVKQWDIESELRNLMSKADYLKTPREKAREKELLDSYLDTVNDRNKIVEDLDEDRLRELEEDEMMAAMIKSFGMSQITQENEKKKTKFGLFRILKTKS